MIKSLFQQTSWYFVAHLFSTGIAFFSFPLWTRYFSVKEYGMLSFIGVTMAFVGPFTKLGLHRSSVRFYSQFDDTNSGKPLSVFYTTLFLGAMGICILIAVLFWGIIAFLGPERVGGEEMYELFWLTSLLIALGGGPGMFISFLRVEEKAKLFTSIQAVSLTIKLALSIVLVMVLLVGVKALYLAAIYLQCVTVTLAIIVLWRQKKLILASFSSVFLFEALRFGLPLVPAELANEISGMGDRFLIQYFMGMEAVGIYSVGYSMTSHLKSFLTVMMFALTPMYVKIWEEHGRIKTQEFLSSVLDYYLMLGIPAIVIFAYFGGDIVVLFASEKYAAAREIIPYLTVPLLLHGPISIYTAGLFVNKKTTTVLYCTLSAGLLNLALNVVFIPPMGLVGAAIATFISYVVLIASVNFFSSRYLTIRIDFLALFKYIAASVAAVLLCRLIHIEFFGVVIMKVLIGVLNYSVLLIIIDRKIRQKARVVFEFSLLRLRK